MGARFMISIIVGCTLELVKIGLLIMIMSFFIEDLFGVI